MLHACGPQGAPLQVAVALVVRSDRHLVLEPARSLPTRWIISVSSPPPPALALLRQAALSCGKPPAFPFPSGVGCVSGSAAAAQTGGPPISAICSAALALSARSAPISCCSSRLGLLFRVTMADGLITLESSRFSRCSGPIYGKRVRLRRIAVRARQRPLFPRELLCLIVLLPHYRAASARRRRVSH